MKLHQGFKTEKAEEAFIAALVVIVLLILPSLGGTAMLVGSVIGLVAYIFLFPEHFRSRSGSLRAATCLIVALAVAAAVVVVLSLFKGHTGI